MRDNINNIHKGSMKILEEVGIKFHHEEILEILRSNDIKVSDNIAYFKRDQIIKWCNEAPSKFTLYARNPKYNIEIGEENVEFAPGYGAACIVDIDGNKRSSLYDDYIKFIKLVHQSDSFNINGGIIVEPTDIDIKNSAPIMLYSTITHSDKCLMGGAGGLREAEIIMNMLKITFGCKEELKKKPRIIAIVNTTSPLMFDKNSLETMLVYAKHNQPVIVTPAAMTGMTAPVTLAGTIALSNAEALAGIAVAQMINKGCPVVYGFQSSRADMRTGSCSLGSPGTGWCIAYGARLAKEYGLPCRGGGANNDAKTVSVQSGYESMTAMMISCQEKMNLIIHSAGVLDSNGAMSYEKFIIDIEITGMIKNYLDGFEINDDTLAVDLIKEVGPGGEFLSTEHTIKYCRKEPFKPEVSHRGVLKNFKDTNDANISNVKKKLDKMLNNYEKPDISLDIKIKLLNYLKSIGADVKQMM